MATQFLKSILLLVKCRRNIATSTFSWTNTSIMKFHDGIMEVLLDGAS